MENETIREEQNLQEPAGETRRDPGREYDHDKDRRRRKFEKLSGELKQVREALEKAEAEAAEKEKELVSKDEELVRKQEEAAEAKDQYLRLQAEWDNYRRRTAKERIELIDNAGKDILAGFLPVLDDCQRALQVLRESDAAAAAIEGTELIYNKLLAYLKSRGVEPIEARGAVFDTDFHEAVAQFPVEDPEKKNTVIDVTQEGYTLNGNVIRFAKVVVGI